MFELHFAVQQKKTSHKGYVVHAYRNALEDYILSLLVEGEGVLKEKNGCEQVSLKPLMLSAIYYATSLRTVVLFATLMNPTIVFGLISVSTVLLSLSERTPTSPTVTELPTSFRTPSLPHIGMIKASTVLSAKLLVTYATKPAIGPTTASTSTI